MNSAFHEYKPQTHAVILLHSFLDPTTNQINNFQTQCGKIAKTNRLDFQVVNDVDVRLKIEFSTLRFCEKEYV